MENVFLPFSQVNGVPQESKLATYMNRQSAGIPLMKNALDALGNMSLEPDPVLMVPSHRRDLTTPTSLRSVGRNGESPSALAGHTPPPLRDSPLGGGTLIAESLAQPIPRYRYQEHVGGTTYYFPAPNESAAAAVSGFQPFGQQASGQEDHSGNKSIRTEITEKNALLLLQPDLQSYPDLPAEVGAYTDLVPLEPLPPSDGLGMIHSSTYKATHSKTGVRFCLRRIHGFRISSTKSLVLVDIWKQLKHPNIVQLREVFTTKDFGDNSIVLVYDYHPGYTTLWAKHFSPTDSSAPAPFSADPNAPAPYSHTKNALLRHQHSTMLPENILWNYIIQLTAAVKVIHNAGLACRTLDPSKVIVNSRNRLRLSCSGVTDVLTSDSNVANPSSLIPHYQQEDLTALGKLVLALSCRSLLGVQHENIQTTLELAGRTYSADLKNLISYLLRQGPRTVTDLMPMIGARFYLQLETIQNYTDEVEIELARELDNSRLFRLLTKLGTINERPELSLDTTWSETGDRYMLKLFRDYLFHQVTEDGRPWLDMAHIVHCLNKLDSGSPEKICLMSRDEQSILVVTYEELKHCLETSFMDLVGAATGDKNGAL